MISLSFLTFFSEQCVTATILSTLIACVYILCWCVVSQVPSTGEEESLQVVQAYDDLSRKLWRLEGLPLSITAVQGAHPALRYTQVKLPVITCCMYLPL